MKKHKLLTKVILISILVFMLIFGQSIQGQTIPTTKALPDTSKMTYNQISNALKLVVFPAKGQSQKKQKKDEFECYKWAMEQSGIDPLNLPKTEAAVQSGPTGGAVKGAARGAIAGVAIGAIAEDAGKGAAIGATAGGMRGAGSGQQQQAQSNQKAQAAAAANDQEKVNSYKKAFSACIEGKGYTVK
jgi:hypothetical protein